MNYSRDFSQLHYRLFGKVKEKPLYQMGIATQSMQNRSSQIWLCIQVTCSAFIKTSITRIYPRATHKVALKGGLRFCELILTLFFLEINHITYITYVARFQNH